VTPDTMNPAATNGGARKVCFSGENSTSELIPTAASTQRQPPLVLRDIRDEDGRWQGLERVQ
jgi:hypothetical protein